ncbi:uncharacterized protein LOC128299613 [Anopheles moucheti]|uniref:uncharacterized protein LOC128299613 n=1 Tax=Anopheles moucheti TaxID=186751 RepID=UPI0022F0646A|nr:uncharacterized protein LOC128299613 [Anopheles moucheti]
MQCIRSVGPGGGGGATGGVERKILIKSEDSRGVANGEGVNGAHDTDRRPPDGLDECRPGQVGSDSDDKKQTARPEVRTFVIGENQCIVYGAGSRPSAPTTPPSLPTSTLQQLPVSHLPPKKTLKLALGLRGSAISPGPATAAAPRPGSPPPLTLRRTSDESDRMMARIQIVSKAHQHPCDDGQPVPSGVLVGGGGQGVHVIRDGRFYQPAAASPQQQRSDVKMEEDPRQDPDHVVLLDEGTPGRGSYRAQQQQQHSSIIVTNGGRNSPPPPPPSTTHQGRLSPAGSGGVAVVQHPHTSSSSIATTTTILVSNERASSYKPATQATSTTTTVSSSKQQQQQHSSNNHHQHGHVTSMQPPPPPPPLKLSKGGGGHEEPSSSMPDLGKYMGRSGEYIMFKPSVSSLEAKHQAAPLRVRTGRHCCAQKKKPQTIAKLLMSSSNMVIGEHRLPIVGVCRHVAKRMPDGGHRTVKVTAMMMMMMMMSVSPMRLRKISSE